MLNFGNELESFFMMHDCDQFRIRKWKIKEKLSAKPVLEYAIYHTDYRVWLWGASSLSFLTDVHEPTWSMPADSREALHGWHEGNLGPLALLCGWIWIEKGCFCLFISLPVFLQSAKPFFSSLNGRPCSFEKWHTVYVLQIINQLIPQKKGLRFQIL